MMFPQHIVFFATNLAFLRQQGGNYEKYSVLIANICVTINALLPQTFSFLPHQGSKYKYLVTHFFLFGFVIVFPEHQTFNV